MRRFVFILTLLIAGTMRADEALQAFTNQANSALQAQFGFGVTNIPIYSPTNGAIRYSAAIHYVLQAAANSYDVTTPATNYPSIFRPLFGWQGSNLFIVGYTNVTTDFDAQYAVGFKDITDPTIGTNDNVWGVPWVVGAKDNVPEFNECEYQTAFLMARKLILVRPQPRNPAVLVTNQSFLFNISNVFGADAWNSAQPITSPVEMTLSNECSVILTNNYNWGTNFTAHTGTNLLITSWPAAGPGRYTSKAFVRAFLPTVITLPLSQWSDVTTQMLPLTVPFDFTNQPGLPVHGWELLVTNNLVYTLLDTNSGTGRVLDFVNLAGLGSTLNWTQILTSISAPGGAPFSWDVVWNAAGGTDASNSPPSAGVISQIRVGAGYETVADWPPVAIGVNPGIDQQTTAFQQFLMGSRANTNSMMYCPFQPATMLLFSSDWLADSPKVHSVIGNLMGGPTNVAEVFNPTTQPQPSLSSGLGRRDPNFLSAAPRGVWFAAPTNEFHVQFLGVPDLPYMIWASTNLVDWSQAATAQQNAPGVFQFNDAMTNAASRFYQIVTP